MRVEIAKTFAFDSAHRLPNVPEGHKCGRLHGHTYRVEVALAGEADPKMGWLVDYGVIKEKVDPLIKRLDHSFLNEIPGLENSTAENLARWIYDALKPAIPMLASITVHETESTRCIYRG